MAHSTATRERALALYVEGRDLPAIAAELEVEPRTLERWREEGIPRSWEEERQAARRRAVVRELDALRRAAVDRVLVEVDGALVLREGVAMRDLAAAAMVVHHAVEAEAATRR